MGSNKMKNFVLCLLLIMITCSPKNDKIVVKEYLIENQPIEDLIILPEKKYANILKFEISGYTNNEIIFYYSHFPFEIQNSIKLNGNIKYDFQTDWYDNQCKIQIEIKDNNTKGVIYLKLIFL